MKHNNIKEIGNCTCGAKQVVISEHICKNGNPPVKIEQVSAGTKTYIYVKL